MTDSTIQSSWSEKDEHFESSLRPTSLSDFVGQDAVRERLGIFMGAALKRNEPLGHSLFYGPPGLGKTTLANILAKTMGTNLVVTSGPVLEKAGDLAGILTSLKTGDILFIDEIHRLNRTIEEYLYPAMEDFSLDLVIDAGPSARSVQLKLNRFTLVGATTRAGLLSSPLRSRFAFTCRLDYYEPKILASITQRSSKILNIILDHSAAELVAIRSRGTPRIANHLLRWVRDFAQMQGAHIVDVPLAEKALSMLAIDHRGLDEMDKKILSVIIDHYEGGPVGVNTLAIAYAGAIAIGEEESTVSEVYEPYLIMQGFLKRTPRGREATHLAYEHLGKKKPAKKFDGEL